MADRANANADGRRWGTGRGGMRWGAVWTLGPYLIALVGVLGWPSTRGQFVFIAAATAPFATLAIGATWLLVLALQRGPARRWAGIVQGLAATLVTYAVGVVVLGLRALT